MFGTGRTEMQRLVREAVRKGSQVLVSEVDEIKAKASRVYHMKSVNNVGGWGHQIAWGTNKDSRSWRGGSIVNITGFRARIPRVDDVVLSRMQSGKVGLFVFTEIEKCGNPYDMFFAKAVLIGYDMNFVDNERERMG